MIRVPRLKQNRHGVYSIRVLWTDADGKRRESLHSLGTRHATTARLLALAFNEAYERKRAMTEKPKFPNLDELVRKYELDMAHGVMKASGAADHALMMEALKAYKEIHGQFPPIQEVMTIGRPQTQAMVQRILAKSMPFSQATAAYLEEKQHDNAPQTLVEKGRTYKDFTDIFGDLDINLYGKPELVQWKTADLKRGIKANRINKRLGQVNDFFNWAIRHGHYTASDKSPVDGLFIANKDKLAAKVEHYEPFTSDELKAIFSKAYLEDMPKPDHYWIPIVSLFTGARREEIASLKAANVKTIDGVPCFQIEGGKTADARRVVPIHPHLNALGFMAYAQHVQGMGQEFLFPFTTEGANGRGKNAGRQFALLLDKRGIKDDRKVFHSFRHTVITRLHALNSNPAHVMQITGHRGETGQSVHFNTYTHDVGLMALAETLGKLVYPLDFDSLKLPDPTFKTFLNRWKMIEDRKARATVRKGKAHV
jgi:integrase